MKAFRTVQNFLGRPKRRQAAREIRMELEKARVTLGSNTGMDLPANDIDAVLIAEEAVSMFPDMVIVRIGSKLMLTFRASFEAGYAAAARAACESERLIDRPALDDLKHTFDLLGHIPEAAPRALSAEAATDSQKAPSEEK